MIRRFTFWALITVFFVPSLLNSEIITEKHILRSMDILRKLEDDVTAKVRIVQQDVEQGVKAMEAVYFAKDINDLFLIVMLKPEAEKGNGYLKLGKNFWMYRRNTRTFQHIARNESLAGSDANVGDFEASKYEAHYRIVNDSTGKEQIKKEKLGVISVYKVEIVSQEPEVDYPKKIVWVREDNLLPIKEQNFSLSGTLMNTQYYLQYKQIKNKFVPVKQMVIDEFEKGNKTVWEITELSFKRLEDSIFTKAYLENVSK